MRAQIRHAVGRAAEVSVPAGAQRLHAAVVTPGLIDAVTSLGLSGLYNVPADLDQDEDTDPNQAALRALDSFNPREPLLAYALSYGVTTVQVGPGPANPIAFTSGFEAYVPKNRVLLFEVAVAAVNGLGAERALSAATIEAARLLGIADRWARSSRARTPTWCCSTPTRSSTPATWKRCWSTAPSATAARAEEENCRPPGGDGTA